MLSNSPEHMDCNSKHKSQQSYWECAGLSVKQTKWGQRNSKWCAVLQDQLGPSSAHATGRGAAQLCPAVGIVGGLLDGQGSRNLNAILFASRQLSTLHTAPVQTRLHMDVYKTANTLYVKDIQLVLAVIWKC